MPLYFSPTLSLGYFATGRYYPASSAYVVDGTAVPTLNNLLYARFFVARSRAFDRIGVEVTSGTATAVVRLGIYADTGTEAPGALLLDAGTIDGSTTGAKEITITQTLSPGTYWLCSVAQTATPTLRTRGASDPVMGQSTGAAMTNTGYSQGSVTGALPGTATPVETGAGIPKVMLRAA